MDVCERPFIGTGLRGLRAERKIIFAGRTGWLFVQQLGPDRQAGGTRRTGGCKWWQPRCKTVATHSYMPASHANRPASQSQISGNPGVNQWQPMRMAPPPRCKTVATHAQVAEPKVHNTGKPVVNALPPRCISWRYTCKSVASQA